MATIIEPTIYELSSPGRTGVTMPKSDVPETALPDSSLLRDSLPMPELAEVDVVRHYMKLSTFNYSVDSGFYPLGSCTMKYNPKINEDTCRLPGFTGTHPLQPIETVPGNLPLRNDPNLGRLFRDNAEQLLGPGSFAEYPHSGGSTDAGDLSQIMPVLHPMMTGAKGNVHSPEWHIADKECGYVMPAKTLAMIAIDLLSDGAARAREVLAAYRPEFTKEAYLRQQRDVFRSEVFNGAGF